MTPGQVQTAATEQKSASDIGVLCDVKVCEGLVKQVIQSDPRQYQISKNGYTMTYTISGIKNHGHISKLEIHDLNYGFSFRIEKMPGGWAYKIRNGYALYMKTALENIKKVLEKNKLI